MPVALLGLVIDYFVVALVYRGRLAGGRNGSQLGRRADAMASQSAMARRRAAGHTPDCRAKAVTVALAAVLLFFTGLPLELVALGAAGVMLLGRVNPRKIYRQVDWSLLVMFAGLFVVVHAFQIYVVADWHIDTLELAARPADRFAEPGVGRAVEPGEQCAGRAAAGAGGAGHAAGESRNGLAGAGDVEHAGGQPDGARLGGEFDRGGECRSERVWRFRFGNIAKSAFR